MEFLVGTGTVSRADTPLRAFLEGLAYCAMLEADLESVCQEAVEKFGRPIAKKTPALTVLANDAYWKSYLESKAAGAWRSEMHRLANGVEDLLNISVSFLSLSIPGDRLVYEDRRPTFIQPPVVMRAW